MEPIAIRILDADEEVHSELEEAASVDRSEVLCRLVRRGVVDRRTETALKRLRDHSTTLRDAAEFANVSPLEMQSLAAKHRIDIGYTTEDLERDLERV